MTLGSGFTREELKGVKYVIVKATLNKDKKVSLTGLFFGFRPLIESNTQLVSKDEKFIWLLKGDNVHVLNANHYFIDSIEIGKDSSVKYSTPTHELNLDRLDAIVDAMDFYKMTEPNGLIDVTKYGDDLPASVKHDVEKDESIASKRGSAHNRSSGQNYDYTGYHGHGQHQHACGYSTKKKTITTSEIRRTTKYPISTAVDKMRAKVEQIRKGKYKPPKLKAIPDDEDKEAESQKKAKEKRK